MDKSGLATSPKGALSAAELRELEKYIKFFSSKSIHIVCHSRSSSCFKTKCNPASVGLHWFNVALAEDDLSNKIASEIRNVYQKFVPGLQKSVAIDVLLQTSENVSVLLERWALFTTPSAQNPPARSNFAVYNNFSVLLRSVICISRILPAYSLSKRLDLDCTLYIKLHSNLQCLSDPTFETFVIGSVTTSLGTTYAQVSYRHSNFVEFSDTREPYLLTDSTGVISLPKTKANTSQKQGELPTQFIEDEIALALSDDLCRSASELPALCKLSPLKTPSNFNDGESSLSSEFNMLTHSKSISSSYSNSRIVAAFADNVGSDPAQLFEFDVPNLSSTPPFISLLHDASVKSTSEANPILSVPQSPKGTAVARRAVEEIPRTAQAVGFEDDFVLVELRPAFFSDDDSVGLLYRKCQSPPALDMFSMLEEEDNNSESLDLDAQIEMYKKDLLQFDRFIESL